MYIDETTEVPALIELALNSLYLNDVYMCHCPGSALDQVMARRFFDVKSLPQLILTYCPFELQEETYLKIE